MPWSKSRERSGTWYDGEEAQRIRFQRVVPLRQQLERKIKNPHTFGNIVGHLNAVVALLMLDAYEAGLRDGEQRACDQRE